MFIRGYLVVDRMISFSKRIFLKYYKYLKQTYSDNFVFRFKQIHFTSSVRWIFLADLVWCFHVRVCNIIGPVLASLLRLYYHRCNVSFFCLFFKYLPGNCFNVFSSLLAGPRYFKHSKGLATSSYHFTGAIAWCNRKFYSNISFYNIPSLYKSLPTFWFTVNYDLH